MEQRRLQSVILLHSIIISALLLTLQTICSIDISPTFWCKIFSLLYQLHPYPFSSFFFLEGSKNEFTCLQIIFNPLYRVILNPSTDCSTLQFLACTFLQCFFTALLMNEVNLNESFAIPLSFSQMIALVLLRLTKRTFIHPSGEEQRHHIHMGNPECIGFLGL